MTGNSTRLAVAILTFWIAGLLLFIAFHAGGVELKDGSKLNNPLDIVKYVQQLASGFSSTLNSSEPNNGNQGSS